MRTSFLLAVSAMFAVVVTLAGCGGSDITTPVKPPIPPVTSEYVLVPSFYTDGWHPAPSRGEIAPEAFTGPVGAWGFDVMRLVKGKAVKTAGGTDYTVFVYTKGGVLVERPGKNWVLLAGDYHVVASRAGTFIAECWVFADPAFGKG